MKRIDYNNKDVLKKDYQISFSSWALENQTRWEQLRRNYSSLLQAFPSNLSDILIGEFEELAKWFAEYENIDSVCHDKLCKIFRYRGKNQSIISGFFKRHSIDLKINSCYYCETAYINTYSYQNKKYSHFDLDHFFPQKKCPILALSLFNMIPSCPTCNQRLKRQEVLSKDVYENTLLSPSSEIYAFDNLVTIHLVPTAKFFNIQLQQKESLDRFKMKFVTKTKSYQKVIKLFRLEERYEFHKSEALRLLRLKQNYPDSHIGMISHLLKRSRNATKEDFFCNKHLNERLFEKLRHDIIGQKESSVKCSIE